MTSKLSVDTIQGVSQAGNITIQGEGTKETNLQQGLAKFWVHFNGTGTIATQDSFNQSALTDNGTGEYTSTFSNNMNNNSYSTQVTGAESGSEGISNQIGTLQRNGDYSTSQVESNGFHANSNADADNQRMMVNVLGDLA